MKEKQKKTFILVEFVLAVFVVILALIMMWERNGEEREKIAVIVQNPDDIEWSAFKYGLEKAAEDWKVDVSVVSTGTMRNAGEEKSVIEQEVKKGVDGAIFQPVAGGNIEAMLKNIRIPVVLIEHVRTSGEERETPPIVGPDQRKMGQTLAEEVLRDYGGDLEGIEIGFFSKTTDSPVVMAREQGAREALEQAGAKVRWFVSGDFAETPNELLDGQSEVDMILALDDTSLVRWGDYAIETSGNIPVYGIGHSTEAVYYLDKNVVKCLVVPDEFNMGYQSVSEMVGEIRHSNEESQNGNVSYKVIRRDTLFSKENQESLFTMSQ